MHIWINSDTDMKFCYAAFWSTASMSFFLVVAAAFPEIVNAVYTTTRTSSHYSRFYWESAPTYEITNPTGGKVEGRYMLHAVIQYPDGTQNHCSTSNGGCEGFNVCSELRRAGLDGIKRDLCSLRGISQLLCCSGQQNAGSQTQSGAQRETYAQLNPRPYPEVQHQPQSRPDPQWQPQPQHYPTQQSQQQFQPQPQPYLKQQSQPQYQFQSEPQPDTTQDYQPQPQLQPQPESYPTQPSQPQFHLQMRPYPQHETQPQDQFQPKPQTSPTQENQPQSMFQPQPQSYPIQTSQPQPQLQSEAQPYPQQPTQPQYQLQSEPQTDPIQENQPQSEFQQQLQVDSQPQNQDQFQSETTSSPPQPQVQHYPKLEPETETQPQPQLEPYPQHQPQFQGEAKPQNQLQAQPNASKQDQPQSEPQQGSTFQTDGNYRPPKPQFLPQNCGVVNFQKANRIVGGRETSPGAYPWIIAVFVDSDSQLTHYCGASLISHRHVVSAAHCFFDGGTPIPSNLYRMRLGDHDITQNDEVQGTLELGILDYKIHPGFVARTYLNDISLSFLEADVPFSRTIGPVCLPYTGFEQDLTNERAIVAGWGHTKYRSGVSSPVLKEIDIPIWSMPRCAEAFKYDLNITDEYLCAGDGLGRMDSCNGDSGGPLVIWADDNRYYLMGIVSFGKGCATPGFPGIYTRMTKQLQWLNNNLGAMNV